MTYFPDASFIFEMVLPADPAANRSDPIPHVAERLPGLDSLRAYAAGAIVTFHLILVGHADPPAWLAFIHSYLGFGVPLFFVVSAFSIAFGYGHTLLTARDALIFYLRRFARIAPLYAMLAFQCLLVFFTYHSVPAVSAIVASLTFTFNFVPRYVDGIVPASWSIGVEMLFYLIFPTLLIFIRNIPGTLLVLLASLFIAAQSYQDLTAAQNLNPSFVYHGFLTLSPYFAMGILFHHGFSFLRRFSGSRPCCPRWLLAWISIAVGAALVVLLIMNSPLYLYFWSRGLRVVWDCLWGIPFGLLSTGLALYPVGILSNVVTRYLGKISFSLYLTHPTIVYYLGKWGIYTTLHAAFRFSTLASFLASLAFTLLVVTGVSSLTYRFIEEPGMRWGKALARRARQGDPAPASR